MIEFINERDREKFIEGLIDTLNDVLSDATLVEELNENNDVGRYPITGSVWTKIKSEIDFYLQGFGI